MDLGQLKDNNLKEMVEIAPNKSISDIVHESLQLSEDEDDFRKIAKNKVEQMQEEINLILSFLEKNPQS